MLSALFSEHFLVVLGFLLAFVLLGNVFSVRRAPTSTLAWVLAIILIPYVGVPLYLMLGNRKLTRRALSKPKLYGKVPFEALPGRLSTLQRVLLSAGVPPLKASNETVLLGTGVEAYEGLVGLIRRAKHSVWICSYILSPDEVGDAISLELQARAREGLEVRVLLDSIGSFFVGRARIRRLRESGAKVAFFMPMFHIPFRGYSNLRTHRKIFMADQTEAIIGGMNIGKQYMGPLPDANRWADCALLIKGDSVVDLAAIFANDWRFTTGEPLKSNPEEGPQLQFPEPCALQVVGSGPDVLADPIYEALLQLFYWASTRIWIATPYFIPDESLVRALELAARRGVDVRILVPEKSNHRLTDLVRTSYLRNLHEAGAKVYGYQPGMLHGKVTVIDSLCAISGSANLDMRSLFLNYEIAVFSYSESTVEKFETWIKRHLEQATPLPFPPNQLRLSYEGVFRLLAPLL
jgi:cardiolipin synthase A/B